MSPAVKPELLPWRIVRSAESVPSVDPLASMPSTSDTGNTPSGGHPEYIAFYLVPVFFIMGLLGVLICHILKKKGYRCTTETEPEEKISAEKIANADVLKAMVADTSAMGDNSLYDPESPTTPNTPISPTSPTSPVSPLTPGGTPSKHSCRGHHLHTIGGVAEKNVCSRCSNKRWNLMRSPLKPKEPKKSKPGAVTVLSVGRFKVTKVEPKSKERKRLMSDGREVPIVEVPPMPVSVDTRQRSGTETEDRSTVYT
ncbi:hypothetical protein GDO81_000256 [Engystomops pustulosus]|uniref:RELT-like protein 1 n=1 Tax=Engystomops pustulosus TaxID=76066 RepID=A0AAV7D4T4_ENGPU|nr:hypothetical protein GDO81_000256 [Engystomops pustulosus]